MVAVVSLAELILTCRKHPLLDLPWRENRLKGVVSLANVWACRGYKYPG